MAEQRVFAALLLAAACASQPPRVSETPVASPAPLLSAVVSATATRSPLDPGPHEASLNGARIYYRVGGSAPDTVPIVVFLHGGPGQGSQHFDALAGPAMERELRMVYYDQRGSGKSERPASNDYALATLVADVEALRRHLGVPRFALVGHSFGALLGLEYASKYPQNVSHLAFVAGVWNMPLQCRLRAQRLAELRPEAYARVRGDTLRPDGTRRSDCDLEFLALRGGEREKYSLEIMFPDPAISARMDSVNAAAGVRNTGELGRALFSSGELLGYRFTAFEKLTMPVLVIAGRHDGAARSAGLRELAGRLKSARFVEFEKSGHFVYLDETDRFARTIAAFVRLAR